MLVDFGFGLFLQQFAIHPFSTNWQSAGVSECTCSKYRFLQTPEICAVFLFTKLLDMLDYRDSLAADKKTQKKC